MEAAQPKVLNVIKTWDSFVCMFLATSSMGLECELLYCGVHRLI